MAKPHRKDDRQPSSAGPGRQGSHGTGAHGAPRYGALTGGHKPEHFHKDAPPPGSTSWDHVASWYDKLVGDEGTDYHRMVLLPAALRMLDPKPHERFLDLCCGQGVFTRLLLERQASYVLAVDASPKLITAAKTRGYAGAHARFVVGDARDLGKMADGSYDGAALLMAVHDLDPIGPVFASMAQALRPGGRAVIIMMHPCFRIPRQSSWGWDDQKSTQYRRLDRYATPMSVPIATHPGAGSEQHTVFFHRPLAEYVNALGQVGLAVVACDELKTHRVTEPGSRSRGENRSREEFPVFLALKVVKMQTEPAPAPPPVEG